MENGVVTVLYFFRKRGYPLKSLHDFWDTLHGRLLPFGLQHQTVDEVFDADLSAAFPFAAEIIHFCLDFFKGKQGAGIACEGFV